MLSYVARRVLMAVPVLFGILLVSYLLVQMLPGDPIRAMMDPERAAASAEYIAQRRAELGLDRPIAVQFAAWVREVFQGNLGYSFARRVSVSAMISERLGPTVILAVTALIVSILLGVAIGVAAALKQNSWFDYLSAVGSMAAISIPNFFLGLLAIYVFAIWLGILPSGGMETLAAAKSTLADRVQHLMLPAGVLAANLLGPCVRYARQGMLDVMRQDYVTAARAKGLPRRKVVLGHGLRNALIPLTTVIALQIPVLLTGVLIIEVVFSWPGLGRLAFEAIIMRDYPVIMGMTFLSAVLVMVSNLLSDVGAALLDPRIRL